VDGSNQSGTRLEGGRSRITIRYSPIWAGSNGATTRIAALPAVARIAAIRETGLSPARWADGAAHDVAAMSVFMSSALSAALAPLMTRRTALRNPHLRIRMGVWLWKAIIPTPTKNVWPDECMMRLLR